MCGIYGIANLRRNSSRMEELLARMGQSLVHRGPDDAGILSARVWLLGCAVSVLSISRAAINLLQMKMKRFGWFVTARFITIKELRAELKR